MRCRWCIFAVCAVLLGGCSQRVTIDSVPRGAEVWIDGTKLGVTPYTDELSARTVLGTSRRVRLVLPGFATYEGDLDTEYDPSHLWLVAPCIVLLPTVLMHGHPMMHQRLKHYYVVVLEEDLGQTPPPPTLMFGRSFADEVERTSLLRADWPHPTGALQP